MRYLYLLIFIFPFCVMKAAYALDCSVDGRPQDDKVKVSDIVIPESAADGSVIWKSDEYDRNVTCKNGIGENVYFYPFPDINQSQLPQGMSFILVYNGQKWPLDKIPKDCNGGADSCLKTDIYVNKNETVSGDIRVQVLIEKVGTISQSGDDELPIYQLDGIQGLKSGNYRFYLQNLKNVATGTCDYAFNKNKNSNNIAINDDLISKGTTINNMASVSVSCSPSSLLKNRVASTKIYTTYSGNGSMFGSNKEGLGYTLFLDGNYLTPSNTESNPLSLNFQLDADAKGEVSINQKIQLGSPDEDWLYQEDTQTTSDNPKLEAILSNFE